MSSKSPKIKILQIVRAPVGGIRKHIVAILETLEKNEHFDWYLATSTIEEDIDEGFKVFSDSKNTDKIFSIKVIDRPEWGDVKNIFKLKKQYQDKNIDIIHGHGAKGGLYARILGVFLGAKVIYTPHGGSLHDMFSPLKGLIYSIVEKVLYPLTDLYIFESQYSLNQFQKKISKNMKKVVLNRNGISLPEFRPQLEIENKKTWVLGSFGALRYIKGHDLIIEALVHLNQKGIHCEYHIYGEGEERDHLYILAENLNVKNQLKIYEKTKDVYSVMMTCDLIIQPSRHESFGYVPLEAMAIGRPVICSNQGGLKEIITHRGNGLLTQDLEVSSFVSLIEELIEDKTLRKTLVENGRFSVESEFSEEIMLKNLKKYYTNLVRNNFKN